MRRLVLDCGGHKIELSVSDMTKTKNPYIGVSDGETWIGTPLKRKDARRMMRWLSKALEDK